MDAQQKPDLRDMNDVYNEVFTRIALGTVERRKKAEVTKQEVTKQALEHIVDKELAAQQSKTWFDKAKARAINYATAIGMSATTAGVVAYARDGDVVQYAASGALIPVALDVLYYGLKEISHRMKGAEPEQSFEEKRAEKVKTYQASLYLREVWNEKLSTGQKVGIAVGGAGVLTALMAAPYALGGWLLGLGAKTGLAMAGTEFARVSAILYQIGSAKFDEVDSEIARLQAEQPVKSLHHM